MLRRRILAKFSAMSTMRRQLAKLNEEKGVISKIDPISS
jgi:hypothetical protein